MYNIEVQTTGINADSIVVDEFANLSFINSRIRGNSRLIENKGEIQLNLSNLTTEKGSAIEMLSGSSGDIISTTIESNNGYGINNNSGATIKLSQATVESINGTARAVLIFRVHQLLKVQSV